MFTKKIKKNHTAGLLGPDFRASARMVAMAASMVAPLRGHRPEIGQQKARKKDEKKDPYKTNWNCSFLFFLNNWPSFLFFLFFENQKTSKKNPSFKLGVGGRFNSRRGGWQVSLSNNNLPWCPFWQLTLDNPKPPQRAGSVVSAAAITW